MHPESASGVVRFVDSHFDADRTPADIRKLIRGVRNYFHQPHATARHLCHAGTQQFESRVNHDHHSTGRSHFQEGRSVPAH
jgi:hypothetical protein